MQRRSPGSGVLLAAALAAIGLLAVPLLPPEGGLLAAFGLALGVGALALAGLPAPRRARAARLGRLRAAVLPAALTFAAGWVLLTLEAGAARTAGALVAALLVALVGVGQVRSAGGPEDEERWWTFARGLLTYVAALALFALIASTGARGLYSATSVTLLGGLLGWSLLAGLGAEPRRPVVYAAVIGLLLGQTTWALNYWQAQPLVAGALLMLLFYELAGLSQAVLDGSLDTRTAVEYALVGVIGFGLVLSTTPWR